jgi:hypothetical protein
VGSTNNNWIKNEEKIRELAAQGSGKSSCGHQRIYQSDGRGQYPEMEEKLPVCIRNMMSLGSLMIMDGC